MSSPANLLIVADKDRNAIVATLHQASVTGGVFTNGLYAAPAAVIVPTTLAGFQYATDQFAQDDRALFVLVNSDSSFAGILDKKNAGPEERAQVEPEGVRAAKVAVPLAEQHPGRQVVVLFYEEETPTALYGHLAASGFDMEGLFKWGYGTTPGAPKIEGAHNFKRVLAFPFVNDSKAICHDITVCEDQSAFVKVVKLQDEGYMTADGKLKFALAASLQGYAAAATGGGAAPAGPAPG